MNFDDIVNLLDPSERDVVNQIVAKQPEIKRGWMRQDDYSRKLDEFRNKESEFRTTAEQFGQIAEYAKTWDQWSKENWDEEHGATKAEIALKQRIQQLEANKGEEMTFDQLNGWMAEQGLVKKADVDGILAQKENAFTQSLQGSAWVGAKLAQIGTRHTLEFQKEFDAPTFLSKVNEYGVNDLDRAYDMFVSDERKTREVAKAKEALERTEKEAFEKGKQEALSSYIAQSGNSGVPVMEQTNDIGHFQRRVQGNMENTDAVPEGRSAASFAAQKWRESQLTKANV